MYTDKKAARRRWGSGWNVTVTKITVDCKKALKHPKSDPKVLPSDKIDVPRRWW